jgi:hypothetical protein
MSDVVKLVCVRVTGTPYPLTLAEAIELADRARALGGGDVELPHTAVAVRLEQLAEESTGLPAADMTPLEQQTLRAVIVRWRVDDRLPGRVAALLEALEQHAA